ncbi:MAG: hypothetical protein IJL66_05760 [Lachnospiraceae bacterium]|nr:hypothetical protein [Lachnospiraceae bacterium]
MYSVPMAAVDFIPVLLFGIAAAVLQRDLYEKMSKGVFALFAAGTIDVFLAGFLKALYKLLYAAGVCDFQPLTQMFFPLQAIGFLLAGLAMLRVKAPRREATALSVAALPVFKGTMIFVVLMVLGLGMMDACLARIALRLKKKPAAILFAVSFVFCLGMGYLASKDFTQSYMNWVAEGVNVIGQGAFLAGALMLHKAGIGREA